MLIIIKGLFRLVQDSAADMWTGDTYCVTQKIYLSYLSLSKQWNVNVLAPLSLSRLGARARDARSRKP